MDGKLCDDMREKKVAVILCGRVNTIFGQQTWPSKRHQPTQLVALLSASVNIHITVSLVSEMLKIIIFIKRYITRARS